MRIVSKIAQKGLPFHNHIALVSRGFVTFEHVERALNQNGFKKERQNGSHVQLYKETDVGDGEQKLVKRHLVTVPNHGGEDIPKGTLASIVRQAEAAGVNRKNFKKAIGMGRN